MTQSAFDIRKNEILNEKSDKSLKKSIDLLAVPIVDLLNRSNQYVTTSRYAVADFVIYICINLINQ